MEYVYATLLLDETNSEINERNLTAVLDAGGADVSESRMKALVAALEDVPVADVAPATGGRSGATREEATADEPPADDTTTDTREPPTDEKTDVTFERPFVEESLAAGEEE